MMDDLHVCCHHVTSATAETGPYTGTQATQHLFGWPNSPPLQHRHDPDRAFATIHKRPAGLIQINDRAGLSIALRPHAFLHFPQSQLLSAKQTEAAGFGPYGKAGPTYILRA